MNFELWLLSLSHVRTHSFIFMSVGLLTYFMDYRWFRNTKSLAREATFTKISSYVFIIIGAVTFIIYQAAMWFLI